MSDGGEADVAATAQVAAVAGAEDYFALFDLPRGAHINEAALAQTYRRMQAAAHPDRYAGASEMERALALSQASRINDAYAALRAPLSRMAHLLSLYGVSVYDETDTAMPPDFIEEQIEWREALSDTDAQDAAARAALCEKITTARDSAAAAAAAAVDALIAGGGDTQTPRDLLRRLTYYEKLLVSARQPAA